MDRPPHEPLADSATTFNGLPRTPPSPPTSFLPIGHIALEIQSPSPSPSPSPSSPPPPTTYKISGLYISRALRSLGLGRTAMNTIEEFASRPPLGAKKLILEVVANEYPGREERNRALKFCAVADQDVGLKIDYMDEERSNAQRSLYPSIYSRHTKNESSNPITTNPPSTRQYEDIRPSRSQTISLARPHE
ncbi:hypothetical protein EYC84_012030 [Monilinia fructicola]|uniref:N-acetyltransferase domain-containing protein n=1 Tax=Monilinia fructicola TaxID=38448 RepID=A0A5M9J9R0_MONFR|nr:hypothetical protein EYC84_012030 [Monilinia fructicola]